MAKVYMYKCDRCGAVTSDAAVILGKDLCGTCRGQLKTWLSHPGATLERQPIYAPRGQRLQRVLEVIDRDGVATPKAVSAHIGRNMLYVYNMLKKLTRDGHIARSSHGVYIRAKR